MRVITIKPQKERGERPLTIIVGLNVSKKAVERNKIRRRIRAIMQRSVGKGKNCVVIAHPAAKSASFQELKNQILGPMS